MNLKLYMYIEDPTTESTRYHAYLWMQCVHNACNIFDVVINVDSYPVGEIVNDVAVISRVSC